MTAILTWIMGKVGMGTLGKFGIKLVGWLLDRSKMKKEEVKLFLAFLKKAQDAPRGSVSMYEMGQEQESDIEAQERARREALDRPSV